MRKYDDNNGCKMIELNKSVSWKHVWIVIVRRERKREKLDR